MICPPLSVILLSFSQMTWKWRSRDPNQTTSSPFFAAWTWAGEWDLPINSNKCLTLYPQTNQCVVLCIDFAVPYDQSFHKKYFCRWNIPASLDGLDGCVCVFDWSKKGCGRSNATAWGMSECHGWGRTEFCKWHYLVRAHLLNLDSFSCKMNTGDKTLVYEILHGFLGDVQWRHFFQMVNTSRLRGHPLKLRKDQSRLSLCKSSEYVE